MSNSLHPTDVTLNLPRDIYELIILEAAQTVTSQITATASPRNLPQNGGARKNRLLASLLTLDKTTCDFLRRLTWNRLGIFYDEEDPNNSQVPAQDLLNLQTEFQNNRSFTKQIEIHLIMIGVPEDGTENHQHALDAVEKLIEMTNISLQILNTANADQIEMISIHLDHLDNRLLLLTDDTDFGLTQNNVNRELRQSIDNLITPILSFQNLTQFEWVSSFFSCVSEQYLGWIVNQLPNLESFALSSPDYSIAPTLERNIDLGTSLASREKLKALVLRDLHTLKESWLGLQWKGKVKEITIKISRTKENCLLEKDIMRFCHLFHQSLTGLYLLTDVSNQTNPIFDFGWPGEEPLTLNFDSLTFLAFDGFSGNLPVFGMFPNVEILFWVDFNKEINGLQKFADRSLQNGNQWTHLRMIVLQPVSGNSNYEPVIPEHFSQCCIARLIRLQISNPERLADLEDYYYDRVKISDLNTLVATSSEREL